MSLHICSLISLHHTLYKIYCFFIQIAQTDQAAKMCRLIWVFTERTCYFAEINVICFFSTCQKLWNSFRCILLFLWQNMFSSTFNNQSLFTKSRRTLLLHIELLGKKRRIKKYVFFFFFFSWKIGFYISCKLYPLETVRTNVKSYFMGNFLLPSAESAHSVVSNNSQMSVRKKSATKLWFSWTVDLFISPFLVYLLTKLLK